MNRRLFLAATCLCPIMAHANTQPWQADLLKGQFDGKAWRAGLRVSLLPGWKTYWRVPGAAGIAPMFNIKGNNLRAVNVLYPAPLRLKAGEDDVIGYKDEVVFPLLLEPIDFSQPLTVALDVFLGVCDLVCIPARHAGEIKFEPVAAPTNDDAVISAWMAKTPQPSQGLVQSVRADELDGKPIVRVSLNSAVSDIFAEGKPTHYFNAPRGEGLQRWLPISGAKSVDELKSQTLRLTLVTEHSGVEEMVTIV